jgi:hypothetical protein
MLKNLPTPHKPLNNGPATYDPDPTPVLAMRPLINPPSKPREGFDPTDKLLPSPS